jgi:hypothetical protein
MHADDALESQIFCMDAYHLHVFDRKQHIYFFAQIIENSESLAYNCLIEMSGREKSSSFFAQ